jgi:hypothetical protein
MTIAFLFSALLTLAALVLVAIYHVRLGRQIRRDRWCKMTCVGGSESGLCPCVGPRDCEMKKAAN